MQPNANDAGSWIDRAIASRKAGLYEAATENLRHALDLEPRNPQALRIAGIVHMECGRTPEAIASWQQAIEVAPSSTQVRGDLGMLLGDLGRLDEALACFDAALAIDPTAPRVRFLKGELLLVAGDYPNGWAHCEARFATAFRANAGREPIEGHARWTGAEPLAGRSVLLHPEVGLGDFIMFARYIPLLQERGARVIAYCPAPMCGLMRSSFPSATVVPVGAELPHFDFQCPIMSLPLALGTTPDSIPSAFPYLKPGAAKLSAWAARLGPRHGIRAGVAWANEPRAIDRSPLRRRGMSLADIEPLFSLPLEFHVLQKQVLAADREALRSHPRVHLHDGELADFHDTAALVELMDQVVTIDTSVAHVAAALAKPTHVLLPPACDYRWSRAATRSPWYATTTLHRRQVDGTWREPVETIRNLLRSQTAGA